MTDKYSAQRLRGLTDAQLEELVQGLSPETEPEYWLAVMEEYSRRESAPTPDTETAYRDFLTEYAGQQPLFCDDGDWDEPHPLERRRLSKTMRILLIAAILSALFAATAFAASWFGLRERSLSTGIQVDRFSITEEGEWEEQETEAVLFIPAGYKDSDEYKASEEWFLFDLAYRAEMADRCVAAGLGSLDWTDDEGASELLGNSMRIYTAGDVPMAEKLLEICEKYSLKLHIYRLFAADMEDFCRLSGTEPFGADMGTAYVFEDGSYLFQGSFLYQGEYLDYSLERHIEGTLPPFTRRLGEPENYEEWEYTTSRGCTVCIDWSKEADWLYYTYEQGEAVLNYGHTVFVSYAKDGAFLTQWGYVPGGKEAAQDFAELFDLEAACTGRP